MVNYVMGTLPREGRKNKRKVPYPIFEARTLSLNEGPFGRRCVGLTFSKLFARSECRQCRLRPQHRSLVANVSYGPLVSIFRQDGLDFTRHQSGTGRTP